MSATATTISAAITATDRSFNLTSATGCVAGNFLRVNDEWMKVQGVSSSTVSVQRGVWGTNAIAHGILSIAVYGAATDFPPRPAPRIYTYGAATGAVTLNPGIHRFSYAGAGAYTIAQPTPDQEGEEMLFIATAAQAYTLTTASGYYFDNTSAYNVATWAGAIGDCLKVVCIGGNWCVTVNKNITLS